MTLQDIINLLPPGYTVEIKHKPEVEIKEGGIIQFKFIDQDNRLVDCAITRELIKSGDPGAIDILLKETFQECIKKLQR